MTTKTISRQTPMQNIEIWAPKYSTREVLIARHKVGTHNRLTFTKASAYPDVYYLSGETIKKCPITTNGKIDCYAVPLGELEVLEYS